MTLGASILEDVAATIQTSAASDAVPDASAAYGTAASINIDSATVNNSVSTADHSGGQDFDEWHRLTKRAGSVDVSLKWGPQGTGGVNPKSLGVGTRVKIIAVTTVAGTLFETTTIRGIVTDESIEYAGPSTDKITLKPCGGVPLIARS